MVLRSGDKVMENLERTFVIWLVVGSIIGILIGNIIWNTSYWWYPKMKFVFVFITDLYRIPILFVVQKFKNKKRQLRRYLVLKAIQKRREDCGIRTH